MICVQLIPKRIMCIFIAIFCQLGGARASQQSQQLHRQLDLYDLCWRLQADYFYYNYIDPRCDDFQYELLPERPPAHCEQFVNPNNDIDINDKSYDGKFYQVCKDWLKLDSNNKAGSTAKKPVLTVDDPSTSNHTSAQPSSSPSFRPTHGPSTILSHSPTSLPSSKPSLRSSSRPSIYPSLQPSSKLPPKSTAISTSSPTFTPTEAPKITVAFLKFSITLGVSERQTVDDEHLFEVLYVFLTKHLLDSFEEPDKFSSLVLEMKPLHTDPQDPLILETRFWGDLVFDDTGFPPTSDQIKKLILSAFEGDSAQEFIQGLNENNVISVHVDTYLNKIKENEEIISPPVTPTSSKRNFSIEIIGVTLSGIGLISILAIYTLRQRKNNTHELDDKPPPMGDLFHNESNEIEIEITPKNKNVVEEIREISRFQNLDEDAEGDMGNDLQSYLGSDMFESRSSKSSLFSLSERSSLRSIFSANGKQDSLCFSDSTAYFSEASTSENNSLSTTEPIFLDMKHGLT